MTPEKFINENYFSLTIDCKREISEIYAALEDYVKAKQCDIHVVSICSREGCKDVVSKNSNCYCIEHAYQHKMEGY